MVLLNNAMSLMLLLCKLCIVLTNYYTLLITVYLPEFPNGYVQGWSPTRVSNPVMLAGYFSAIKESPDSFIIGAGTSDEAA